MTNSNDNRPIEVFRAGGVKASVWLNRTEDGKGFFSVSIVRSRFVGLGLSLVLGS